MPVQHVNNDLLKAMRRTTSKEDIMTIIGKLHSEILEMTIRTSLIVGFPGETKEHFEELSRFIQENPLDNVGIFQYSQEEGSHAASLPEQINEKMKGKRQRRLAGIQQKVVEELNRKKVGTTLKVIVEVYHPESNLLMVGRHQGQCPDRRPGHHQ